MATSTYAMPATTELGSTTVDPSSVRRGASLAHGKRRLMTSITAAAVGAALCIGGAGPASAATPAAAIPTASAVSAPGEAQYNDLVAGLTIINNIPDDVLKEGGKATQAWMQANYGSSVQAASVLGCAAAISGVIATTAFPVAKLLKIKALIKGMGGVVEAAKAFWGASFSYEKVQALGGAAAALSAELIGIAAVKKGCFS